MANLFGFNPEDIIRGLGSALHSLLPVPTRDPGLGPADHVAGSGRVLPSIVTTHNAPLLAPAQISPTNWAIPDMPFGPGGRTLGVPPALTPTRYLGIPPSGRGLVEDPMGIFGAIALQEAVNKKRAEANKIASPATGGGGWAGPATADDNKGITADKVEQVIAATRANSPMRGKGQLILSEANRLGVSVPEIMGIFLAESELGTTAGPTWNVAGLGGVGNFQGYNNIDDAIRAAIGNLATSQYRGKSLEEQIGTWFVGPQGWAAQGLNASDGANGTVADYIRGKVAPMYAAFGVPLNQTGTATRAPVTGGGGGLAAVTGGQAFPIMQEFGRTPYSVQHPSTYAYGSSYGLAGDEHPGIDWAAPIGTQVYTPVGGVVSVVGNDHGSGYYYTNTMTQGDLDHSGEFALTLPNGDILILGHMSSITAQVGQQLAAGTPIGLSGGSDGAHVHIEYRKRNPNGGYTVVDPRTMLGGGR